MIFLIIFGGLIGFIMCYMVVVIFFPGFTVKPQPVARTMKESSNIPDCRKNVEYSINNETIRSWLYLPKNTGKAGQ